MKLERTKNTKRNLAFGTLNTAAEMLLQFVARTIIIQKLGADYLGLNSLFTSILQVLNMSEMGFSSAIVYSMYRPIAEQDDETVCALLRFYRKVYRIVGAVVLAAGLCLLPFLPFLIEGESPDDINIYVVYVIYLVNTSISYCAFAYKSSLLSAYQRADVISLVETISITLQYVLQIAVLIVLENYYLYIVLLPVFTLLNNALNAYWAGRLFPQYTCRGELSSRMLESIRQKVSGLMISKVCVTTRNSFDSIFISAFLGLTMTAIYNNYYLVFSAVIKLMYVITNSMTAGVGNSVATETREKNYDDLKKINFLYMWISGWCTCCMLCLYQPFMELWVGEDLMLPLSCVVLLCLYFYVLKMGDVSYMYSESSGLWWELRHCTIAEAVANVVLNLVLVQVMGVDGIILATLLSLFLINFGYGSRIIFRLYFQNGKLPEYYLLHLKYAAVAALACVACYSICSVVPVEGIAGLVIRMLICCAVPNAVCFICYRHTEQYRISVSWLLTAFHLETRLGFLIPNGTDAR